MVDRAVSDTLSFVLVFTLIISSVGVATVYGIGSLQETRDFERVNNAERAFEILADNLHEIHAHDAPNRATELKLADAQLKRGETTRMTVEITNAQSPNPRFSVDTDPIVYTAAGTDTSIVYSNGAVIREDRDGAILKREPRLLFGTSGGETTAVIPFIETRIRSGGVGGSSTVLIRAERASSDLIIGDVEPDASANPNVGETYDVTMTIETTTKRGPVWDRYLDNQLEPMTGSMNSCSESTGIVTCSFSVHELYVSATRIDVKIE
ncbi:hypothetical protein HUG10_19830 (plasmid) [Halorarum halophilum]|uniref:Uncharacterized protein n=1 Tax=Halorarum halophilum TaxID=2743090 RepID=A0A7D5KPU9_9EURY|nr:hypothetical protein [Halobaculum halophilum]QLG29862.1 hypothetical protein HUG10_19830 [Halobaculum halophilum]